MSIYILRKNILHNTNCISNNILLPRVNTPEMGFKHEITIHLYTSSITILSP